MCTPRGRIHSDMIGRKSSFRKENISYIKKKTRKKLGSACFSSKDESLLPKDSKVSFYNYRPPLRAAIVMYASRQSGRTVTFA